MTRSLSRAILSTFISELKRVFTCPWKDVVDVREAVRVDVEHGDVRAEAVRDLGRVEAHDASADDRHLAALDSGTPASRMPLPPKGFFQILRAFLDAETAGDFAHGFQQLGRSRPAWVTSRRLCR
jgi:hypothetical protein